MIIVTTEFPQSFLEKVKIEANILELPGLEELLNYGSPINASNKFKIQRQPSSSSNTTIFVHTIGKYTYI